MAREWIKKGTFIGRTSMLNYLESKGFRVLKVVQDNFRYTFIVQRKSGKMHKVVALLGELVKGYGDVEAEHYRERFVQGGLGSVVQILGFKGV